MGNFPWSAAGREAIELAEWAVKNGLDPNLTIGQIKKIKAEKEKKKR